MRWLFRAVSSGSTLFALVSVLVYTVERVKENKYTFRGGNSIKMLFASLLKGERSPPHPSHSTIHPSSPSLVGWSGGFSWVLYFSRTFDERSARSKWNILERAIKPKKKKNNQLNLNYCLRKFQLIIGKIFHIKRCSSIISFSLRRCTWPHQNTASKYYKCTKR